MKLIILGLSCSGKTTISNQLSKILKTPCYHLDSYYWEGCWIKKSDFNINEIINMKEWIIDGNYYKEEFIRRLNESDFIIYLNVCLIKRLCRMVKRHIRYKKNPDLLDPISNRINLKFIISTIRKHLFIQPKLLQYLKKNYSSKFICTKKIKEFNNIKNEEDFYKLFNAYKRNTTNFSKQN